MAFPASAITHMVAVGPFPRTMSTMKFRRWIRNVLAVIGFLVVLGIGLMLLGGFFVSRPPAVPRSATLVLRPQGTLVDTVPDDLIGQIFNRETSTVRGFIENLHKAQRDERIKAVLLMPGTLDTPYWGKVQELREAVLAFRKSGKRVIAFLEYGGDREYYLASAADRIVLLPTSPLDLTGVASYQIFLRGTLDKLGVFPDYLRIGEYKTAPNQLTETAMTPAHREMAESLNREAYDQLVAAIATSRRKTDAEIRATIDRGPFTPDEARRAGLVDDLAYPDQLDDRISALRDGGDGRARIEGLEYARVNPRAVGIRPSARIAVLQATGAIVSGRSGYDPTNGATVGSDTLVDQIRRVRADDSIDAIVLRVDSPGGSSIASDVIWRELTITREAKPKRPLITSMSDLAASGGYYISVPAHAIVAEPGTLTGSIGIYTGKLALGDALRKVGVTEETVASGANADINSPFAPFTPAQRVQLGAYLQTFYQGFVQKVATSRHLTTAQVDALGRGRVWTGSQAQARGLVDRLGGLDVAVAIAKERAGIPADADVRLVTYAPAGNLLEALASRLTGGAAVWNALSLDGHARVLAEVTAPARLFRRGEPLALMPYVLVR